MSGDLSAMSQLWIILVTQLISSRYGLMGGACKEQYFDWPSIGEVLPEVRLSLICLAPSLPGRLLKRPIS